MTIKNSVFSIISILKRLYKAKANYLYYKLAKVPWPQIFLKLEMTIHVEFNIFSNSLSTQITVKYFNLK